MSNNPANRAIYKLSGVSGGGGKNEITLSLKFLITRIASDEDWMINEESPSLGTPDLTIIISSNGVDKATFKSISSNEFLSSLVTKGTINFNSKGEFLNGIGTDINDNVIPVINNKIINNQITVGPFNAGISFTILDFRNVGNPSNIRGAGAQYILSFADNFDENNGNNGNLRNFKMKSNNNTDVQILYTTDESGTNLGEMFSIVTSNISYPNGLSKKLIGYCKKLPTTNTTEIDTFYSFRPKLSKVLKLTGDSLLDQTNNINLKYNFVTIDQVKENCKFFGNILGYSTLRYMLAGLSNNSIFSCKWLYSNNYKKFLRNLENSEFSYFVRIFTEYPNGYGIDDFTDYNKYFRSCEKHLQ